MSQCLDTPPDHAKRGVKADSRGEHQSKGANECSEACHEDSQEVVSIEVIRPQTRYERESEELAMHRATLEQVALGSFRQSPRSLMEIVHPDGPREILYADIDSVFIAPNIKHTAS